MPSVGLQASFSELMREMSAKGLGASAVVDASGQVQGIFTDGDLRRSLDARIGKHGPSLRLSVGNISFPEN